MAPIKFSSTLQRSTNKLWGAHFEVPAAVVKKLSEGSSRRVVCTLNDVAEYQCAMLPHGNGTFVISVNKSLRTKLRLEFGDTVRVQLEKDESEYGLPMPLELKEVLKLDKEGNKLFHALTAGKLRTLLYFIGKGKDTDTRIATSIVVVSHLKANRGKLDYRKLSVTLKAKNTVRIR